MGGVGRAVAAALLAAASSASAGEARFDWVTYRGLETGSAPNSGQYRNPVLPGFYPDPSLVRVGRDFYLVNSTFAWFPGIPVWHSRDLVHWRQVGNAISRPGQLDFARLGMSRGVFAPTISFHGGMFYIASTCVDCGGNFMITARDPAGPWSDPHWLRDVEGIDPSLFFDDDGTAWLVNNRGPAEPPHYEGHRAIWLQQVDLSTFATRGRARVLVDGGVDISEQPAWIEGPHLFKHDGRYYLSAAEGGTAVNHRQVIFRAETLDGPFIPASRSVNPILTQRDLDPKRPAPITSAGHADMVRLPDGNWWAVFLATRPYAGDFYNTGRETFLLPVTWDDGWPTILDKGQPIPAVTRVPPLPRERGRAPGDPGLILDNFAGPTLARYWMTMRTPLRPAYRLTDGALVLAPGEGIGTHGHPAFVGRRQQQARAVVTTSVRFHPAEGEAAGLAAVQDDDWFLTLALARRDGREQVEARRRAGPGEPADGVLVRSVALPVTERPLTLRVEARGGTYTLSYAQTAGRWRTLANVDGTILSTARAGGFTGALIGPFAQTRQDPTLSRTAAAAAR